MFHILKILLLELKELDRDHNPFSRQQQTIPKEPGQQQVKKLVPN